jgi:hypothetical protein
MVYDEVVNNAPLLNAKRHKLVKYFTQRDIVVAVRNVAEPETNVHQTIKKCTVTGREVLYLDLTLCKVITRLQILRKSQYDVTVKPREIRSGLFTIKGLAG